MTSYTLDYNQMFRDWVYSYLTYKRIIKVHDYPYKIIKLRKQLLVFLPKDTRPKDRNPAYYYREPSPPIHLDSYKIEALNIWCRAGYSFNDNILVLTPRMRLYQNQ